MGPPSQLLTLARHAAETRALDPGLVCAVIEQESAWNPWAMRYEPAFFTKYVAPLYTNNKLTPAPGFNVPEDARAKYDISSISVGTDPSLTMNTRRGTGYYKVPSLKGVWYRSMFGHSGWCATLEDWFDPKRLNDDYIPTGFKSYGTKTYPVRGHTFGLDLTPQEKKDLIAFLKTL